MYRIKLTNGTVLEFDSIESLTVDIHAGVVDADALIFHQRANQWLPIHVHPVWKQALATPRKAPAAQEPRTPLKPAPRATPSATAPAALPGNATAAKPSAPAAASPAPGRGPVAKAAPASAPQSKQPAAPNVSVERLDEVLELLSDDELELPHTGAGSTTTIAAPTKPARAPKPAKKTAAPSHAPKAETRLPADDAALLDFVLEPTAVTAALTLTPTPTPAKAAAVAPVPVPVPAPLVAMSLPPSTTAADTLVPAESLLVEPIEESVVLSVPIEDAAPLTGVTTDDLASELHVAIVPLPAPELESAAPAAISLPVELPAPTDEPLLDVMPTRSTARPNRTIWYVGGAVAAAGVVMAVLAMRGEPSEKTTTPPAPKAEPTSSNPGIPGAPLTPPPAAAVAPASLALPTPESAGVRGPDPKVSGKSELASKNDKSDREAKPANDVKTEAAAKSEKNAKTAGTVEAPKAISGSDIVAAPDGLKALGTTGSITLKFDIAPSVLAGRYIAAQDAAWNDLVARLRVAGFDNLFSPARTAPSGANSSRAAVAAARAHIAQWRTRSGAIDKAYRDSASTLANGGAWGTSEQREWESRTKRGETGESAQQTNAIMAAADRLFGLLAANSSAYEVGPDGLRFTDSGAQRDYWETRRTLTTALGAASTPDPRWPLALVLKAVGSTRPPEGLNVN